MAVTVTGKSLVQQIQDDALGGESLAHTLRKVLALGGVAKSEALQEWARQELQSGVIDIFSADEDPAIESTQQPTAWHVPSAPSRPRILSGSACAEPHHRLRVRARLLGAARAVVSPLWRTRCALRR